MKLWMREHYGIYIPQINKSVKMFLSNIVAISYVSLSQQSDKIMLVDLIARQKQQIRCKLLVKKYIF